MSDPHEMHANGSTRPGSAGHGRWKRRWNAVTDHLGAQKPLNLILYMLVVIACASAVAHLS